MVWNNSMLHIKLKRLNKDIKKEKKIVPNFNQKKERKNNKIHIKEGSISMNVV